jgi:hypothetical protein
MNNAIKLILSQCVERKNHKGVAKSGIAGHRRLLAPGAFAKRQFATTASGNTSRERSYVFVLYPTKRAVMIAADTQSDDVRLD